MGEYCRVHHLDLKVPLSCQAVGGLLNEADPIPRNILVGPNGSTTKPELAASNKQGQTISQPGGVAGIIAWLFRRERGPWTVARVFGLEKFSESKQIFWETSQTFGSCATI